MVEVLKYIQQNIETHLTLSEVSSHFGYSKWRFCRQFHANYGSSFVEYVRHYKMQLAAIDILDNHKVIDVALRYGYDTVSGFNKAFLIECGCLPREFKKQSKKCYLEYIKRRENMFHLSDRGALLREEAVNVKSLADKIFLQRQVLFSKGINEHDGDDSIDELISAGMSSVIENFIPHIMPGELIVGFNLGDGIFGEYFSVDNDEEGRKLLLKNGFNQDEISYYFNTREDANKRFKYTPSAIYTQEEEQLEQEWVAIGRCIADNHSVINYALVLELGFTGILEKIKQYEKKNGSSSFYSSMKRVCEAAIKMGDKYATLASKMAKQETDDVRKKELQNIAQVCYRVPRYGATSFHEAVQSLWFAHIINTWEDGINANSLGRLDQILYPYYKTDIDSSIITPEFAHELICCLWIKLYRDYDVQQSCVGGVKRDGSCAINDLSYMMLDATESLDFIRCLSVRFSPDTDPNFMHRALEVVGHVQKGVPFFFNDKVMIEALTYKGIPLEDARDYTQIGCVETVIPGKSNPHAVSGETNLLKALEFVLCNGHSMKNPDFLSSTTTGELDKFDSYDKLWDAVLLQIDHILDVSCKKVVLCTKPCETNSPKPFKSMLTIGCIENGLDFNNHGAMYDYYQIMLGGIPNLADSLMVIKKFIYDDKKYTLAQLKHILEGNFEDEAIRLEFLNKAPKFGNDFDEVDSIAVDITDHCCDYLELLSKKYNYSFHAQPFTFLWMVDHGTHTAASPDGRRSGEIIAYSVSPMQGRDYNGLTALLNSLSKLPTNKTPGTTSAIIEVDPKLFIDKNIGMFVDMLLSSASRGLSNVQFNTIDADMLIDAQKYPDRYNNLAVRVSGFSQKFNLIDKALQDHIIGRTKHQCM